MERQWFDEFSKSMARGMSRRRMLAFLGAAILTGCGNGSNNGGDDPPTANPGIDPPPTTRPTPEPTATKTTINTGGAVTGCLGATQACFGTCVDVQNDSNNCGQCGTSCEAGFCQNGVCQPIPTQQLMVTCDGALTDCAGQCVDLQNDLNHCGECNRFCESGICSEGRCITPYMTEVPMAICESSLTPCNGVCVDLQTDPNNCGDCSVRCISGACNNSLCLAPGPPPDTCEGPLTSCSSGCVDLQTDQNHCGACGVPCLSGICDRGLCLPPTCGGPLTSCFGVCVPLQSDPNNCGACGVVCSGEVRMECVAGACSPVIDEPVAPISDGNSSTGNT